MGPDEPSSSTTRRKYYLYLTQNMEGAGSFNIASGEKHQEGSSIWLCAYTNPNYQFEGWKVNGELTSTSSDFYLTMPGRATTVEALFSEIPFDPDSPSEPTSQEPGNVEVADPNRQYVTLQVGNSANPKVDKTSILLNPLRTIDYEIGLDSQKFYSTTAQYQIYSFNANSASNSDVRYAVNQRPVDDGVVAIGLMVRSAGTVSISAMKLERPAKLYDRVTGTEHDLSKGAYTFTSAAGTFNDRFEIHTPLDLLMGDVNNDKAISVADLVMLIELKQGHSPAGVHRTAADMDSSGTIDLNDVPLLINKILRRE